MLILGIETSTQQVGVAVAEWRDEAAAVLASATVARRARHAENLVPAVDFVCRGAGAAPADLDGVAVGVGPGLFTGLRVGIATAQAVALALDVPAVGLSSLDVVAHGVRGGCGPLIVAMDARRGELFWAAYSRGPSGEVRRRGPDRVDPPDRVAAAAADLGAGAVVVGDGPARYPAPFAHLAEESGAAVLSGPEVLPSPVTLVLLGARALADGRGGPAASLAAVYVREPDAARWTAPAHGAAAVPAAPAAAGGSG